MGSEVLSLSKNLVNCPSCGYICPGISSSSENWIRSVKRKYNEFEEGNRFFLPRLDSVSIVRVEIEDECDALRKMVSSQQLTIQGLHLELEEERNASESAANEAMSMILRLQREKAEIQMEARQFKRFAEEKMAHDHHEISALEDLLYNREQTIHSLTCEIQAYKHRMMSYGLTEAEVESFGLSTNSGMNPDLQSDSPKYEYPPLLCNVNAAHGPSEQGDDDVVDVEKYAFGETPRGKEHLKNLETKIFQKESTSSCSQTDGDTSGAKNITEKVIVGYSPRNPRQFSADSSGSFKETCPEFTESPRRYSSFKKTENHLRMVDDLSETGDGMSDRVYTIDSVHCGVSYNGGLGTKTDLGAYNDYVSTPRESLNYSDIADPDIKKLYLRLQSLEADRESMRQALVSMRNDKAQLALLKEIAQHWCQEAPPIRRMPIVKKSGGFSAISLFKVMHVVSLFN